MYIFLNSFSSTVQYFTVSINALVSIKYSKPGFEIDFIEIPTILILIKILKSTKIELQDVNLPFSDLLF